MYKRRGRRSDCWGGRIRGGREGRKEGGHNSLAQLPRGCRLLSNQRILRPQRRRICANSIRLGSPIIFVVDTFFPSRFRRLMTDSEMDFTILLKREIAGLKADLRSTRAQHTADLASTASAANDLAAAIKGTAHVGTPADIVSAATDLAVLLGAAAEAAADQSAIVGHAIDDVVVVEAVEHRDIAAEAAADVVKSANDYAVNLGATADIDRLHGDVGGGEFV